VSSVRPSYALAHVRNFRTFLVNDVIRRLLELEFGAEKVRHGRPPAPATLATHDEEAIEAALRECKGRVAGPFGAAVRLGVPSSTLESKIKALKIDKRRFKST
jgi:DNA-binding NtrC family response regulator